MRRILIAGIVFLVAAGAYALGRAQGGGQKPSERGVAAAPELRGRTTDGGAFSLDRLAGEMVVLAFHRADGCPICLLQLEELSARSDEFDHAGARILVVTAERTGAASPVGGGPDLGLDRVLVAPAMLRAWGAWDEERERALHGAAVVDSRGRLRYRHVWSTPADRASAVELLSIVRGLAEGRRPSE